MTPSDAADFIDSLSPVEVKNRLLDLLLWQAKRGKTLVHISWYLRKMKEPKPQDFPDFRALTQSIGNSGG